MRKLGRCELRGLTVVELEHAAEPLPASDGAAADRRDLGRDKLIVQALVRPFFMIVIDERSHRGPEVAFAEWHEPRQTLGSDRPHKSLRECVQIRTPGRQSQGCHPAVAQQVPEGGGVEWVSVQNDVLHIAKETVVRVVKFRAICVIQSPSG